MVGKFLEIFHCINPSSPLILSLPHYFNELNFSIGLNIQRSY
jgi:hypothetical protein